MVKVNKLGGELRPISLLPASNFVVVDFLYCLYAQSLHHGTVKSQVKTKVDTSVEITESIDFSSVACTGR